MYKKMLKIKGDTNDADYTTRESVLREEDYDLVVRFAEAIKNCKEWGNYPYSEYIDLSVNSVYPQFNEVEHDIFMDYVPFGIHSIVEIEIHEVKVLEKLF